MLPPPPPPGFKITQSDFITKRLEKLGTFSGSSTEELNQVKQKVEDMNSALMVEAEGIGFQEEKEVDKTTHSQCFRCEKWIANDLRDFHDTAHSSRILDWMYLGAEINANNYIELTKRTNISYILNAAFDSTIFYPEEFQYLHLKHLQDIIGADVSEYFDECIEFIDKCKNENKNILIHCIQGVSRSTSIVLMYLMKREGMTLKQAFDLVKSKRPIVRPNVTFAQTLVEYEFKLFGCNTANAKYLNSMAMSS